MGTEQGYIKLYRRFFRHEFWREHRTLSRAEAWLDLIFSAKFEASKEILNNRVIEVQRGELIASRRFLEQRWLWGSSKVTNFLDYLKTEGMINQRQTAGQTIIIICKYDYYNEPQTSECTENEPATNDKSCQDMVSCGEKTNQRQCEKQTTFKNCHTDSCDNEQTSNEPPNEPATNQRRTSDEPATNQNKRKKEREERKEYNTPLSPDGDISPRGSANKKNETSTTTPDFEKKEKSSAKKERAVFSPPSVESVAEYCKENGYTVSPWRFVNHYTSNGWMVGKNKMKDWKAAVRTWQSNENQNGNNKLPATARIGATGDIGHPKGLDAANKRTELGGLKQIAGAVLRGTVPKGDQ